MGNARITQRLEDDLKVVLDRAEDLLELTAGASSEALGAARQGFLEVVESLRDEWKRLPRQASRAARASGRIVREHPYETAGGSLLLLVVVVGAVWLWQRSR